MRREVRHTATSQSADRKATAHLSRYHRSPRKKRSLAVSVDSVPVELPAINTAIHEAVLTEFVNKPSGVEEGMPGHGRGIMEGSYRCSATLHPTLSLFAGLFVPLCHINSVGKSDQLESSGV